jgi:hypothetical protein
LGLDILLGDFLIIIRLIHITILGILVDGILGIIRITDIHIIMVEVVTGRVIIKDITMAFMTEIIIMEEAVLIMLIQKIMDEEILRVVLFRGGDLLREILQEQVLHQELQV